MRHRKKRSKLSMMRSHRKATMRNMVKSLIKYQTIRTTLARAKELRRLAENLITIAKDDTVFARRRVFDVLTDRDLVGKLFKEVTPLFKNRTSGYTRIIPLGFRKGDGAELAIIEFTEKKIVEKPAKKKKEKAKQDEQQPAVSEEGRKAKPKAQESKEDAKKVKDEHKKEESKKEEPRPKHKPTLDEERRVEKAKSEDRKMADQKGFMKNIRGLFRKRGDR